MLSCSRSYRTDYSLARHLQLQKSLERADLPVPIWHWRMISKVERKVPMYASLLDQHRCPLLRRSWSLSLCLEVHYAGLLFLAHKIAKNSAVGHKWNNTCT